MGALKIDCLLNETQMDNIVGQVANHMYSADCYSISDFDDTIHDVRVCVEFNFYLDKREIKSVVIFNSDWDELPEDSAVFLSRLRKTLQDISKENRASLKQQINIREDQLSWINN